MTQLLEKAIDHARNLPIEAQDDLARVLLQLSGVETPVYRLSAEEASTLARSLAQAAAGNFATEETVDAIWSRHGR